MALKPEQKRFLDAYYAVLDNDGYLEDMVEKLKGTKGYEAKSKEDDKAHTKRITTNIFNQIDNYANKPTFMELERLSKKNTRGKSTRPEQDDMEEYLKKRKMSAQKIKKMKTN